MADQQPGGIVSERRKPRNRPASETAEALEPVAAYSQRYVLRALHRGEHLDDVDQALNA